MTRLLPQPTDPSNGPSHSFLHRVVSVDSSSPESSIDVGATGIPLVAEGIKLGGSPTVSDFQQGRMFYDSTNKTISAQIDGDITLQVGQEEHVLVYNNTVATIENGMAVYVTGANGDMPTVAKAKADVYSTSVVLGITTQAIPAASSGLVTVRGIVHDLATTGNTSGHSLYLSDTTAGTYNETDPTILDPSHFSVVIGYSLLIDATTGSVYVERQMVNKLNDLADVAIGTPAVDQILTWNGVNWINGPQNTSSAGLGVSFFLDNTYILPPGAGPQTIPTYSLLKIPSVTGLITDTQTCAGADTYPSLMKRFVYDTALGGTQIDAGIWTFNTFSYVDATTGVTSIPKTVRLITTGAGTVAITGSGTSRTATVSGGTPFVAGDANANPTLAGLLRTPNALFQITGFTSTSEVTVLTLSTYTNESGVAYSKDKFLFTTPGIEINNLTVGLNTSLVVQPAFPIAATDKLEVSYYCTTTSTPTRTVSMDYGSSSTYTNFVTPLVTRHNDLAGLQGGISTERYHITSAEATVVSNTSGINTGDDKTSITGVLKGNGSTISAATVGTDYSGGTAALSTGIVKTTTGTGALTLAVSGSDIKTINSTSILGAGNITASVINWLGAYSGATSYIANDAVSIAGNSYICILATGGGIPPPNLTYWNILAQQGDPGVAGVSGALTTPFTAQTSVTVTHNFNAYPSVQCIDGTGEVIIPLSITHTTVNAFTVLFTSSTSGNIISTIGGVNTTVVTKSSDYLILSTDNLILCTASLTLTLPSTTNLQGKHYYIKNTTGSAVNVVTTGGKTIDGQSSQQVIGLNSTMQLITDGSNWFII